MAATAAPGIERDHAELPVWLLGAGYFLLTGSAIVVGRLVWEQTALTWQTGEQMVGFSLIHGDAAPLIFVPVLLLLWLLVALTFMIVVWRMGRRPSLTSWTAAAMAAFVIGVMAVPYTVWQDLFVGRLAVGPKAPEFLVSAAYRADRHMLEGLISRGVPVDARGHDGETALHGAARGGQLKIAEYLIAHGTDMNAVDLYGDSPLEAAAAAQQYALVQYLTSKGAKRLRGDSATRAKATETIVARDMARADLLESRAGLGDAGEPP